jgi:hypothetical protein
VIEERDRARELDVDATLDLHTDNCLTTLLFEFSRATASSRYGSGPARVRRLPRAER